MGDPQRPPDRPIGDVAKDVVADDAAKTTGGRPGKTQVAIGGRTINKAAAIAVAAVVGALLIGGVGFAVTRGSGKPASPAVAPVAPVSAAPVAASVIVSGNASVKVVANGDTTVDFQWTATGAKPGDIAAVAFRGPGVPPTLDIPVGADGKFGHTFEVGKFGSCSWGATVTSIGGRAVQSFFPAEVGICITTNIMRLDPNRVACNGSTMHLEWKVILAPPGAPLEIALTGPGLPPTLSLVLGPDGVAMQDLTFPRVSGTATMTAKVVSIGPSKGPWLNSTTTARFDCLP